MATLAEEMNTGTYWRWERKWGNLPWHSGFLGHRRLWNACCRLPLLPVWTLHLLWRPVGSNLSHEVSCTGRCMWTIPNPTEEPVISQDLPKGRPGSLIPGCYENTNHLGSIDIFTESDLQSSRRQLLSGRNWINDINTTFISLTSWGGTGLLGPSWKDTFRILNTIATCSVNKCT